MKIFRKFALKLKTSTFSWDATPDLSDFLPEKGEKLVIIIEEALLYKNQRRKIISYLDNIRLKKLRKSIKLGYITKDDKPDEGTHVLTGGGKGKNLESLLFSKDVNGKDRLTYRAYKIKHSTSKEINEDGKEIIVKTAIQKVVLESCIGHQANGQGDYYNDPEVKAQFNRKRHKDNNSGRNKGD